MAGHRPRTCPWYAFRDPLVQAVQRAYSAVSDGEGGCTPALLLPLDPPNAVWEGLLDYVQMLSRCMSDRRKREEQERKAKERTAKGR